MVFENEVDMTDWYIQSSCNIIQTQIGISESVGMKR
jgi:hypothetical protein